jgi:hypothetical protein
MTWLLIIAIAYDGGTATTMTHTTEAQCRAALNLIADQNDWVDNDLAICVGPDGQTLATDVLPD